MVLIEMCSSKITRFPSRRRLAFLGERREDAVRGRGHLGHPHADSVVDRVRNRRRLGVVGHLADRLRPEGTVDRRVLDDHVVELGQIVQCRPEIRAELATAVLDRRVVRIAVLGQRQPEAHDRAALDLSLDERRVDRAADVVDLHHLLDDDFSGLVVDLDLGDARGVRDRRMRFDLDLAGRVVDCRRTASVPSKSR